VAQKFGDGLFGGRVEFGDGVFEEFIGDVEGLGDDADVGDDGHEVDVAVPARDEVGVEVSGDAGAGAFADVDADVEALGVHGAVEGLLAEGEEFHHFGTFFGGAIEGRGGMAVGGGEEMAVDVGVFVEHEEGVGGTGEDEVGVVLVGGFGGGAKEAVLWAVGDGFDVVEAPGGVEGVGHFGFRKHE
jgi:hypothetical protein